MLKPIRWNTFIKDFLIIQIGFALYGLAIALSLQANIGTNTWTVFEKALADIAGLTVGNISVIVAFFVLLFVLLLKEKIGWGTLGNILSIGPWTDLFLKICPELNDNLVLQIPMLLAGILVMGIASAVYIGVNAGAGPRDSLMLAIHRTTKISLRLARSLVEITVFIIGWILGGPAGIGTIIFALLIGPSVQWAFKIFKVKSHAAND